MHARSLVAHADARSVGGDYFITSVPREAHGAESIAIRLI
jgi:hypothetical protein